VRAAAGLAPAPRGPARRTRARRARPARAALPARARLLAVAALLAGCGDAGRFADDLGPAPAYGAVTLDGDSVALAQLRGEAVLLNVWATWCVPCRVEIPELQALHEVHGGDGLRVVGVTVDARVALDEIRSFMAELGMTYDVWWDPDQVVMNRFNAHGVPFSVLMDRDGRMVWRHLGMFQRGDPALLAALERVMEGREAS
jgi:cytochrome c biogenesis protein CcmG, thiol:disulfide interchange protein DsbE